MKNPWRSSKSISTIAMTVVLLLVVTACGANEGEPTSSTAPSEEENASTTPSSEGSEEFSEVTLAIANNLNYLTVFVAQDLGLWTERGLDVSLLITEDGTEVAAAMQSGAAYAGAMAPGTGVPTYRAGGFLSKMFIPFNQDATNALYSDWIGTVGRADHDITTDPTSIMGKSVSAIGGGASREYLRRFLDKYGMTEDDIEVIPMSSPDMVVSLMNGDLDVINTAEPFRSAALLRLGENAVEVSAGEPLVNATIGLGGPDGIMAEHSDVFRTLMEGLVEAAWIVRQDPDSFAPVVLSFLDGFSEEEAAAAIQRMTLDPRVSVCTRVGATWTANYLVQEGHIEWDGEFTEEDLIDASMLDEVLADHPEWTEDLPPLPEQAEDCTGYDDLQ